MYERESAAALAASQKFIDGIEGLTPLERERVAEFVLPVYCEAAEMLCRSTASRLAVEALLGAALRYAMKFNTELGSSGGHQGGELTSNR